MSLHLLRSIRNLQSPSPSSSSTTTIRSFANTYRSRRTRIEPLLSTIHGDSSSPIHPEPRSSLTGNRLILHKKVQSLIRSGDLDSASSTARLAFCHDTPPTVFTCNSVMASLCKYGRYEDAVDLFRFFFVQSRVIPNVDSYNAVINAYCKLGLITEALNVYKHILDHAPFNPSRETYKHLTDGFVGLGRINEAILLNGEMRFLEDELNVV